MSLLHADNKLDLPTQKARLRHQCRALRAAIGAEQRPIASRLVSERLLQWLEGQPRRKIGVFLALPQEICLDELVNQLLLSDFIVSAPRVDVAANEMNFWRLTSLEAVTTGAWNVREPVSDQRVVPEIVLVPGLAFDQSGGRLGMGGGWYDRVLAHIPIKIGVCFDQLVVPQVPLEPHDIKVDFVATDQRWFDCRK